MTIPNQLTIFRILLIPVFVGCVLFYAENEDVIFRWSAIVVFIGAAVTDGLDGWIARRFNLRSPLGAVLDPLADKALLVTALITLTLVPLGDNEPFPMWFLVLVLSRDALLLTGVVFLKFYVGAVEIAPHWSGKAATALQMVAIAWVLLTIRTPDAIWVIGLAGWFTLISAGVYLVRGIRVLSRVQHEAPHSSEPR